MFKYLHTLASAQGVDEYGRNIFCEFALVKEYICKHMHIFSPAHRVFAYITNSQVECIL